MPNVIENSQQIGIIDIPTKLSFPVHPKSAQNEPGMCKGVIGPGASLSIKFSVTEPNIELNWKIKAKTGPLKLVIYRRPIRDEDMVANGFAASQTHRDNLNVFYYSKDFGEQVEKPKRISRSKKDFAEGSIECDSGFIYTTSISNANFFPTSISLYYNIYLNRCDEKKNVESMNENVLKEEDCQNIHLLQDSDERKACINDLLTFVGEITLAEYGQNNSRRAKKRGKQNETKKNGSNGSKSVEARKTEEQKVREDANEVDQGTICNVSKIDNVGQELRDDVFETPTTQKA